MNITFDPDKDKKNVSKHGISLAYATSFEWDDALVWVDKRRDYGECRMVGIGYIGNRLFCMVFVNFNEGCRIISLRKANKREIQRYAET